MFLPLELTLRPSRINSAVRYLGLGLALLGIWLADLVVWLQLTMTAGLFVAAVTLQREGLKDPRGLRVGQSGQIHVLLGEWKVARIHGRPVVLPWFASLVLVSEDGGSRRLIIWPDSLEPDAFRKLRVWLHWARPSGAMGR